MTSARALFSPPPGTPLTFVVGVSHQSDAVDDLVRPHPELLPDPGLVELGAVIPDGDVEPRRHRPRGEGPDDVVGLETLAGDDGDA